MRRVVLALALLAPGSLACVDLTVTAQVVGEGAGHHGSASAGPDGGGGAAADAGAGGAGGATSSAGGAGGAGGGSVGGSGGAGGGTGGAAIVPFCGDGVVNVGSEECDGQPFPATCEPPGHPQECHYKPQPVTEPAACPGADIDIDVGDSFLLGPYDNTNGGDDALGTCVGNNVGGRDHVFNFQAVADGTVTITVGNDPSTNAPWCETCSDGCPVGGGCWIPVLYVRTGGCSGAGATEIACVWDGSYNDTTPTIALPVQKWNHYWVFVDSYWDGDYTAGPYYLEASMTP